MDIAIIIGGFALISTVLFFSMNRIHNDITGLSSRMDASNSRMDASNSRMDSQFSKFSSRMDSHASRTDQLYQMFVDLLKERK